MCVDDNPVKPGENPLSRGTTGSESQYFGGPANQKNLRRIYLFLPDSPCDGFSIPPPPQNSVGNSVFQKRQRGPRRQNFGKLVAYVNASSGNRPDPLWRVALILLCK